jgi:uncharacterized membrane protein
MITKEFSKTDALRFGWSTMRSNLGFFIGLLIVVGIAFFVPNMITKLLMKNSRILSIIISISSWIFNVVIYLGLIRISLRFCNNKKAKFTELFSCFPLFFKYLFGSILYGLTILGGVILMVVPGIIWAIQFMFFSYFIVDKGFGATEALKRSSLITKGVKWDLFVFGLLLIAINLLGALCLLVGLFATIPTSIVALAFVYRKLLAQTEIVLIPKTSNDK